MDIERVTEEYLKQLNHVEMLKKQLDEYKKVLVDAITRDGEEDDKGHQWLPAGQYMLQRQRRQGARSINPERAEQWAKDRGVWDEVSKVLRVVDEDALVAYIYDHRDEDGLEDEFQTLFDTPKPSYAFIKPVKGATYDY